MFEKTKSFNFILAASILFLITSFVVAYFHDMGNMLWRWGGEDLSYCYIVPLIFIYIIYTKTSEKGVPILQSSISGLAVIAISGFILLAGHLGSLETLTYISVWLSIVGISLVVAGRRFVSAFIFPYVILAFIIPIPSFINNLLSFRLKLVSSAVAVKIMQMSGLSVFREGNIIDLGAMQLQVVDACSGLRYVYPLLLTGFVVAYFFNKRWTERLLVLIVTIPISVFANSMRIAVTGYLMERVSREAAEGFFHGFSGWLIFMVSLLILLGASLLIKYGAGKLYRLQSGRLLEKPAEKKGRVDLNCLKSPYICAVGVLFILFWQAEGVLSSNQIIPQRVSFESFPADIGEWKGERSYLTQEILDSLWADDYLRITYINPQSGDKIFMLIPYYEYQDTRHTAHAPASCLVGGGYAPIEKGTIERGFPEPFNRVKIGRMILEKDGYRILSNFWFQQRGRVIANEYANKWFLFWDSVKMHRTDGALIRLEMPITSNVTRAQAKIDEFIEELVKVLPEYIPMK